LGAEEQAGATPFAPRCRKDLIEEVLFASRRDIFTSLDLVFFDTTSIYFEGAGGETIGRHGPSKDHRGDLKQMIFGVVLDDQGNPLCSEMWPGSVADVKSLVPVVDRLKSRFHVGNVCIVADRGMISEQTKQEIEKRHWRYILGVRMRRCKQVKETVLSRSGRYQEVFGKRDESKAPAPLKVKEVSVEGRRYIVCLNDEQATKDRADREAITASLRDALRQGDKSLIGNKGYRRFVRTQGKRFVIDEQKVKEEARYDGKWVLTTNTELSAADLALKYKQLWMVEAIFRSMKSLLETRPIFHKCDDTIRGHVFCSFLALLLCKELQDRLANKGLSLEWADVIRALDNLVEMDISVSSKAYTLRGPASRPVAQVFSACGVALPPVLRQN
jgi:transposase